MWYDDPYEECVDWFWQCLGDDDTLPKEFLEGLLEMCDRIDRGEEKTYSFDEVIEELRDSLESDHSEDDSDLGNL